MLASLRRRLTVIILLVPTMAVPGLGAQYWVARGNPTASDDNPGTASQPWKTLGKAAVTLQPGDTLTIGAGVYRESLILAAVGRPEAPITVQAARVDDGGYQPVVITGADIITDWEPLGDRDAIWVHRPWSHVWCSWSDTMSHGAPPPVGRCEQVIVDGELLRPVLSFEEMEPGTFFADPKGTQSLYVRLPADGDPRDHLVEASTRQTVVKIGSHTRLRGLVVRYAANMAQHGALVAEGDGWFIEDCVVEWTNGAGLRIGGENYLLRRVKSRHNGQMGMGGSGKNSLIESCEFVDNNMKGFSAEWEAGGFKLVHSWGLKVWKCVASRNHGPGMWFDIDNFAGEIRQCRVQDNTRSGIFIEISGDFVITDNLCTGNGGRESGDWAGAGICLGEARDCYVAFNTCVGNMYGISIRGQVPRGHGGTKQVYLDENITIRNNLLAYNDIAGFGLLWDNAFFGRHPLRKDLPKQEWQAKYGVSAIDPDRVGLVLESNYYACPGTELVRWGVDWREKWRPYYNLDELRDERHWERHGQTGPAVFVNRETGDFRLKEDSPVIKFGAGLRYPVAGMKTVVARSTPAK